jgi:hypothetical protein
MSRKSSTIRDHANQRFAWLLEERGFAYWTEGELDSKIDVQGKRPDFYVETGKYGPLLVEVESFEESTPGLPKSGGGQFYPETFIKRIRTAVKHAARQLKPYQALQVPMLIVLDNWRMVGIPSDIGFLREALFGSFQFRFRISKDHGIRLEGPKLHHGAGQTLHPERKFYVSAVAWNMPKHAYLYVDPSAEKLMRLRMIHNDFAPVRLPIDIFSDGEDEHYAYDEGGHWSKLTKGEVVAL